MSAFARRGEVPDDGYSRVPHGLWNADLQPVARLLLGWLHSHSDTYLASLTIGRASREFGSRIQRPLDELVAAGFVEKIPGRNGCPTRFLLDVERFFGLRRKREPDASRAGSDAEAPDASRAGSESEPDASRAGVPDASRVDIEEQREEQPLEEHSCSSGDERRVYADDFEAFWSLYPKNNGSKKVASERWGRLSKRDRQAAMEALPRHVEVVWAGKQANFIPHASTWLGRKRWADEIVDPSTVVLPEAWDHASEVAGLFVEWTAREFGSSPDVGAVTAAIAPVLTVENQALVKQAMAEIHRAGRKLSTDSLRAAIEGRAPSSQSFKVRAQEDTREQLLRIACGDVSSDMLELPESETKELPS